MPLFIFIFMFIFWLSPNKKKKLKIKKTSQKNLHSTRVYQTRVLCNFFFFFFFKKKVLEPGRLEYCVNGTRVYQARVPQKIF